jgi:hypothetical protein
MSADARERAAGPAEPVVPESAFLGMLGSSAVGWVRRVGGEAEFVELYVDGALIDRAPAARAPLAEADLAVLAAEGLVPSQVSSDADWFMLKTPMELRAGRELAIEVRGRDGVLGSGRFRLFGALKAKFVHVKDGVVRGFASNPVTDDPLPNIQMLIDGRPAGVFAFGPAQPDGRQPLDVRLPPDLRDGEFHQIAIRWAGSTVDLPGSPQIWKAPGESGSVADLIDDSPLSRPTYDLPRTELAAVGEMLGRQGLARRAPDAVASHAAGLWAALERPGCRPGPRLNLVLVASAFSDLETAFALSQLLALDPSAACHVLLPSEEARRYAVDDHRDDGRDQLARPLVAAQFMRQAALWPADDLVVFAPPRAVLSETFLARVAEASKGAGASFAGPCAQAALDRDGGLLMTSSAAKARWLPAFEAAAVLRAGDLAERLRIRRFEFEGAGFDELDLRIDGMAPVGAVLQAPQMVDATAADVVVTLAQDANGRHAEWGPGASERLVYEDGLDPAAVGDLAELAGGDGSVLVMEAARAAPGAEVLAQCRALAWTRAPHELRYAVGPFTDSVEGLATVVAAAQAQPAFGVYVPPRPPPVRD